MMEEKAIPPPLQVTPVCNVNVELDHLRAEIARLRQQQDGIHPVVASVEQSHPRGTPRIGILDESPSRGFACRDPGKQRSEKVAIDHVVGRRATATPFVGGRRCSFGGRFLCNGTWRGTVRPVLRAVRVVGSRCGLRAFELEKLLTRVPRPIGGACQPFV